MTADHEVSRVEDFIEAVIPSRVNLVRHLQLFFRSDTDYESAMDDDDARNTLYRVLLKLLRDVRKLEIDYVPTSILPPIFFALKNPSVTSTAIPALERPGRIRLYLERRGVHCRQPSAALQPQSASRLRQYEWSSQSSSGERDKPSLPSPKRLRQPPQIHDIAAAHTTHCASWNYRKE